MPHRPHTADAPPRPFSWILLSRRVSLATALLIVALQVVTIFVALGLPPVAKLALLLLYYLVTLPDQRRIAHAFALATVVVALIEGPAAVEPALDSALFLGGLVFVLTQMAAGAARSPNTAAVSQALMSRPVGQIYLPLSLASHIFAAALNVGAIPIFMTLLRPGGRPLADERQLRPACPRRGPRFRRYADVGLPRSPWC